MPVAGEVILPAFRYPWTSLCGSVPPPALLPHIPWLEPEAKGLISGICYLRIVSRQSGPPTAAHHHHEPIRREWPWGYPSHQTSCSDTDQADFGTGSATSDFDWPRHRSGLLVGCSEREHSQDPD